MVPLEISVAECIDTEFFSRYKPLYKLSLKFLDQSFTFYINLFTVTSTSKYAFFILSAFEIEMLIVSNPLHNVINKSHNGS